MSTFNESLTKLMNTLESIKSNIKFDDNTISGFDSYKALVDSSTDRSSDFKVFYNIYSSDIKINFEDALHSKLVYICPSQGASVNFSAFYKTAHRLKLDMAKFKSKKVSLDLALTLILNIYECLISLDLGTEDLVPKVDKIKRELGLVVNPNEMPDLSSMLQMVPQLLESIVPQLPQDSQGGMPQASDIQSIIGALINSSQIKGLVNDLQNGSGPPDMQSIMSKVTQLTSDKDLMSTIESSVSKKP